MKALVIDKKIEMLVLDQPSSTVGDGNRLWHVSVPSRWSDAPAHLWLVRADDIDEAVATAIEHSRQLYNEGQPPFEDAYAGFEDLEEAVANATYLIGTFSAMADAAEAVVRLEDTVYSHQDMAGPAHDLRSALIHAQEHTNGPDKAG